MRWKSRIDEKGTKEEKRPKRAGEAKTEEDHRANTRRFINIPLKWTVCNDINKNTFAQKMQI